MKLATNFLKVWLSPWREYVSEFFGVSLFVFLASAVVVSQATFGKTDVLVTAVGIGFSYACVLYATSHVSGGFLNPAAVVSLWLVKRLSGVKTIFYLLSQMLASFFGSFLVFLVFGERTVLVGFGAPVLGYGISLESGLVLEALLSSMLVLLIYSISIAKTAPSVFAPLVLGFFTVSATIISLPVSGAGLNVARSLGPIILSGDYSNLLVYVGGGFFGSLVGFLYESVFLKSRGK